MQNAKGTIVSVKVDRGFGFIMLPKCSDKIFFHADSLEGIEFDEKLREREVVFDVFKGPKGLRATNVRPARP